MSIWVNDTTKVIVQGITGSTGAFHTKLMLEYGTKIVEDRVTWKSKLSFYQPVFFSGKDDFESLTMTQLMEAGLDGARPF